MLHLAETNQKAVLLSFHFEQNIWVKYWLLFFLFSVLESLGQMSSEWVRVYVDSL